MYFSKPYTPPHLCCYILYLSLSMRDDVEGIKSVLECQNLSLPFQFPFYNDIFDEAWVCAGGMITFMNPNETALLSNGVELGIGDGGGLPIIAPFWAGLNPYPYCADIKYKGDTDAFHLAFSHVPPEDFDVGSFVSWQLSLSSCGDFSIKILSTDFQMEVLENPELSSVITTPINMTIGWQESGGQRGINICHGGVECGCLEWPLVVSATGGKCSYDPEVLSVTYGSHSGAAGGDTMTLTTINLDSESEEWLRLRFTSSSGALVRKNVTLDNELSEFEKGKLVFNTPAWEGAEVVNTKMELLYNISNEVTYLQTGSTWNFFGVWHNITIGGYSNENISYILADGSEYAVFHGSGFSTSGVYYLRLTSQDATIDPAEQTDVTCNVQSDTKMTCQLPKWGETRGPDTGVTLAIIQNKNGEITAMNTSFDSVPQYTVRPTIKGYSIPKAGAAGGQNVSVYGQGFNTEEGVYSCTFSTLSSTATAIGNTELQCLTPTWGDAFSAGSTTIEITATSQIALPASVPSSRSFTFLEEWSTLTQYSGTAKGGDRIAVVGYGFKNTTDEKYYCRVSSIDGYMITDAAEYIGPKLLTCDTKVWNYNATEHANFSIWTDSENAKVPVYDAAANETRTEDHLVYAVYEEVVEASASGGSAWGGLDMLVGVHGLNPTEYYYVKFVEDSTEEYVWTDITLPKECGEELSDESIRYCVPVSVPRWVHNVHNGASVDMHVYHKTGFSEEHLTGYIKFAYHGYNADLYTITTNLSLSGGVDCESFDSHNDLRDSIATIVGYSHSPDKVGLKFLPCTSSTRRRRLAETPVLVTVTVQVKDKADADTLENAIDNSEFESELVTALSSKGLSISGVEVTWKETALIKANIDCECGHELKESAEDNTFSCSVCSQGFFSIDGQVCTQCWSGMSCEEHRTCVPDPLPGYWRKNTSSPVRLITYDHHHHT